MGENFILRWNDHPASILSAASREDNLHLCDVTLGTIDRTFRAHRLILSVCSTSLGALFAANGALADQSNPFIFMQEFVCSPILK